MNNLLWRKEKINKKCQKLQGFLLTALLLVLLLSLKSMPVLGLDSYSSSAFSPSLIAAIRSVTGERLEFPLSANDPIFKRTSLDLSGQGITGLKGLAYFTNLTGLNLDSNKLTTLSWVEFPENIRTLSIAHNAITNINDAAWPGKMTSLDLANNRLTSPSYTKLPAALKSINLSNNFLTNKLTIIPSGCSVNYEGNFIYEANKIRPATLVVKDISAINLSPKGQQAVPFISITSSTNPNNTVPPALIVASLVNGDNSPLQLTREEYRFLVTANKAGTDSLLISLNLTSYTLKQYDNMNLTFHQVNIPVTVWADASERPGATSSNNGDSAVEIAVSGRSNNAVVDMTRFRDGRASFSPGLLSQLAAQEKKLVLTHDFGNLTLEKDNLISLANQAAVSASSSIVITLDPYDMRPVGFGPSRFSEKEIFSLQYKDYNFQVQLSVPGKGLTNLDLPAPVTALLYLRGQDFTAWDFEHLTAIKDNGSSLDILGGTFDKTTYRFNYLLNGAGRYGLGTRAKAVNWIDLRLNSNTMALSDGTTAGVDPAPLLYQGSTMVPIRSVFERMGATVQWNSISKTARISYRNKTLYLSQSGSISGTDMQSYTINGRMLVPLRYISAEIGATVLWWSQDGRIRIVY